MKKKVLKIFITLFIIGIILIGLLTWGIVSGVNFIKSTFFSNNQNIPKISTVIPSKNNSSISSNGFRTISSYNIFVASITTTEEAKGKQKIILINPGIFFNITKQDILSNNIETQLKNIGTIGPVQIINFDKFQIVKKGSFKVNQQVVPYVKGNFGFLGGGNVPTEGIVGVIDTPNGKNNLFISIADSGKFKLKIVEEYFKQYK